MIRASISSRAIWIESLAIGLFSSSAFGQQNTSEKVANVSKQTADSFWQILSKFLNIELISIGDHSITLKNILIAIIFFIVGLIIAKYLTRQLRAVLLKRFHLAEGATATVQTIFFYFLLLCCLLFSLNIANIPLTIFTVVGGAVALGVGFGSQNVVRNFISGLILLIERPMQVGDWVEVEGIRLRTLRSHWLRFLFFKILC